jgi:hypothetical protein
MRLDEDLNLASPQRLESHYAANLSEGEQSVASEDEVINVGDWVRITRAPSGYADYVREAVGAQVTYTPTGDNLHSVDLYTSRGRLLRSGVRVRPTYLTKIEKPVFRNATSDIPETAEILALKEVIYDHAMRVGRRSGMCGVLNDALEELGVQKPPPGKVKVKVIMEVEVDPERVIAYTNWRSFPAEFDKLTRRDQARNIMNRVDYDSDNVRVEYEVIPPAGYAPTLVTAPAATPTPESVPQETKVVVDSEAHHNRIEVSV